MMQDVVSRMYPIFFSTEFQYQSSNFTCSHSALLATRKRLVKAALLTANAKVKGKTERIEELTSFRPFNVRELNFDVCDDSEAKFD
jgi:hypothetical protein